MASLSMRAVGVAVALVLSGTPAALAACAAVCVPGLAGANGMTHAAAAAPVVDAMAASAPHAHHHQASVTDTPAARGSRRAGPAPAAVAGVGNHDCCPAAAALPATSAALVRGDARLGAMAATAPAVLTPRPTVPVSRSAFALRVAGAPPLRSRTPLVLRI